MPVRGPLVVLNQRLRGAGGSDLRRAAREEVEHLVAAGVVHAELGVAPLDLAVGGLRPDDVLAAAHDGVADCADESIDVRFVLRATSERAGVDALAERWSGERVVGVEGLDATGIGPVVRALDGCAPARVVLTSRLLDDCTVVDGRIVAIGPLAAQVRDRETPVEVGPATADHPVRLLFDAGFRVVLAPADRLGTLDGFDDVELAACAERAAVAAFLPEPDRDALVARVRAGWDVHPARLFHLAERAQWEASRTQGSYLPVEFGRDGFIHLSARHQLLTPANRFYRGRDDLLLVELDAHFLGDAVVWEAGTDTVERFPHLYGAITPEAVLGARPFPPGEDGSFLL